MAYSQPVLVKKDGHTQLLVDGKPFVAIAGELHNSTSSGLAYFTQALKDASSLNINTVIASISWEQLEPREGQFDYFLVDSIIQKARSQNLKLVLIWFASWKNGESAYVPGWVKADPKRFVWVKTRSGFDVHTISPFCKAAMQADARAFAMLMKRIREQDTRHNVIMMQVENEVGAFSELDYNGEALYNDPVPASLIGYMSKNELSLEQPLHDAWVRNGRRTQGNWPAVFGEDNYDAQNFFMSWQYANYINAVCEAGKKAYSIPMYVNCWLVQHPGEKPGEYPNGGPVSRVMDIYKVAAPSIDLCAPDIYLTNFREICHMYTRPAKNNPLFIPECEGDNPGKAYYALGECDAIGFSPFGVESMAADRGYAQSFAVLGELLPLIRQYQGTGKMRAVLKEGDKNADTLDMGNYQIEVRYKRNHGPCYGIIIQTGADEFLVGGIGLQLKFRPKATGHVALVSRVLEGSFRQNKWETIRLLNGDESGSDYTANITGRHYNTARGKEGFSAEPAWVYVPGLEKDVVEAPGIYKVSVLTVNSDAPGTAGMQDTPRPAGPLPTARQVAWEDKEFYLFTHFGPNTFTDLEWGKGTEKEAVFNPTGLDCRQWCRIAKAAGARGIIITAKHHDGFCLWPSQYSTHTVAQSAWKDGKGDVLRQLSDACREYGLELGIYLSPWDRNHPQYGTPDYNAVFINMMKEVVSRYGPLFEFWWDGANGEGPNGKKQVYDWQRFQQTLRDIAPNTPVFSDIGPDIRWVGNENGIAGITNWDLLDTAGFSRGAGAPPTDTLNQGNIYGKLWLPAECDVSIRPGWFYHQSEDTAVKSPERLFDLYLKSVGRGANLLLNVPPDRRGLFTAFDSAALMGFRRLRDESFRSSLVLQPGTTVTVDGATNTANLLDGNGHTFVTLGKDRAIDIAFGHPSRLNCILLQEPIQMGQRVINFRVEVKNEDGTVYETKGTTIGHKRILTFPAQNAVSVHIVITDAKAVPLIGEVGVYLIPEMSVEP
jgi:alpha-L-fucosidase